MRVVIAVKPASLADIDEVAGRLTGAGMTVDQILSTTGIITGSADAASVATLSRLMGVASIEPDTDLQIPPDGPNR